MDFCAALEQAVAKAPTSEAAEYLRRLLEDCRKGDGGGVVTPQGGGGGTGNPPQPGGKPSGG